MAILIAALLLAARLVVVEAEHKVIVALRAIAQPLLYNHTIPWRFPLIRGVELLWMIIGRSNEMGLLPLLLLLLLPTLLKIALGAGLDGGKGLDGCRAFARLALGLELGVRKPLALRRCYTVAFFAVRISPPCVAVERVPANKGARPRAVVPVAE